MSDMEVQYVKSQFKVTEHTVPRSLTAIIDVWWPLMTSAVDRFSPPSPRASGPSSRVGPQESLLWFDMLRASLQHSSQPADQPASLSDIPTHTVWSVSPVSSTGSAAWQCWLRGSDGPADGAFCPAAPWGQVERESETGVFMFHLLPPSVPPRCPWHWFWRKGKKKIRQKKTKGTNDGGGGEGKCDVMEWKLIPRNQLNRNQ